MAVEPGNGALHVWLSDCSDLAPADSSSTAHGDCQSGHGASIVPPSGSTSSTGVTNPSSQPGSSPSDTFTSPSPTSPVVVTTIPGITVSGVVTIGNPTIVPGAMPTSSGIASLQPLASQAAQLYASAESAIATLASATSPSSSDVSSAEQALARVYSILQVLLADAEGIDSGSVSGSDAQQLQNLRAHLPSILSQLGSAITQLGPSTDQTPDSTAIQDVAGLLGPDGAIGQALSSDIMPVALHSSPGNPGGAGGVGGGGSGGSGDEITITGFTTIPSNTGLGLLPTAGPSAISALQPAASQLSSAIDAASQAASSLASDSSASSGATSGLLSLLSGLFQGRAPKHYHHSLYQLLCMNLKSMLISRRCVSSRLWTGQHRVKLLQCRRCLANHRSAEWGTKPRTTGLRHFQRYRLELGRPQATTSGYSESPYIIGSKRWYCRGWHLNHWLHPELP